MVRISVTLAVAFLSLVPAALGKLRTVTPASAQSDPVIAAAGDIACDPNNPDYMGGVGTAAACRQLYTSNLLVNGRYAAVLPLGDNQYYGGAYASFRSVYDPTWGRVKSISRPVPGNHDYGWSPSAAGYFKYFGSAAGPLGQGWYSFNVGAWHLIALNSQCANIGGCGVGSTEYNWLASDLAANANRCTLAYWHIPLFASSSLQSPATQPLWQLLYNSQADVVLNGHAHIYERFAPQDPFGNADPVHGIREFIVGTGGADHSGISVVANNSQVRNTTTFGVLALSLHRTGYDWQFVPENGSFTDSGSGTCRHPAPLPPLAPTGVSANSVTTSQVSLGWSANTGSEAVAGYKVYRNGTEIATVSSLSYTDNQVEAGTDYSYYVKSYDVLGQTSDPSNTVSVTIPSPTPQVHIVFGESFESGNLAKWNFAQGLVVQSNRVATGQFAARARSMAGPPAFARATLASPQGDLNYQMRFNVLSLGSYPVNLLQFLSATGQPILTVRVDPSLRIVYFNNITGQSYTSNTTVGMGTWHPLRVRLRIAGSQGRVWVWYDRDELVTLSQADNFGTAAIGQIQFGEWRGGLTYDIAFDNIWAYVVTWSTSMAPASSDRLAMQAPARTALVPVVGMAFAPASQASSLAGRAPAPVAPPGLASAFPIMANAAAPPS